MSCDEECCCSACAPVLSGGKAFSLHRTDICAKEIEVLEAENARLREALRFYAEGNETLSFHGEKQFLSRVANSMDISEVHGQWKTGARARAALEDK